MPVRSWGSRVETFSIEATYKPCLHRQSPPLPIFSCLDFFAIASYFNLCLRGFILYTLSKIILLAHCRPQLDSSEGLLATASTLSTPGHRFGLLYWSTYWPPSKSHLCPTPRSLQPSPRLAFRPQPQNSCYPRQSSKVMSL